MREVTVARKSRRQMIQVTAPQAPEQEHFFIGDWVKDRVRVGASGSVHNDREPLFLFT